MRARSSTLNSGKSGVSASKSRGGLVMGGGVGDCGGCSESEIRQYIMRESRDSHRWGGGADGVTD